MKKLLLIPLLLTVLSCSSDDDNSSKSTNKGFNLKTENLSFQDGPEMPEALWLSSSTSNWEYFYVSDGLKNYEYDTSLKSWKKLPNTYMSKTKKGWSNLFTNGRYLLTLNGYDYETGQLNKENFKTGFSSAEGNNNIGSYTLNVKGAGSAEGYNYSYYIAGGSDFAGKYSSSIYEMNISRDGKMDINSPLLGVGNLPEAKETQIEVIDYKLYVIGGYNEKGASKRIDVMDLVSGKWTYLGDMPIGFSSHATAVQGKKIWIVGNYNSEDTQLAYFNTENNDFVTVNSNLIPRKHANAEIINNKLYVFSGATTSSSTSAIKTMQVAYLK